MACSFRSFFNVKVNDVKNVKMPGRAIFGINVNVNVINVNVNVSMSVLLVHFSC